MSERSEIEWHKSRFCRLSQADLEMKRLRTLPTLAEHKAAHELLAERAEMDRKEMLHAIHGKPEWKTWSFWMALLGILIGLAGLAVAILALRHDWQVSARDTGSHAADSWSPPPAGQRPAPAN